MIDQQPQTQLTKEPDFIEPQQYVYSNAYRIYGTGADITIEFGRSKLLRKGENPTIIGEAGVVMTLSNAERLVDQLQETIMRQKNVVPVTGTFRGGQQENDHALSD